MLIDPVKNTEVTSVGEIKNLSLKYCQDLLSNRPPRAGYEEILEYKHRIHDERMVELSGEDNYELTY